MKQLILAVLLFLSFGLTAQQQNEAVIGRAIETTPENMRIVTIGVPLIKIIKTGKQVTAEDFPKPQELPTLGDLAPSPSVAPSTHVDSNWIDLIGCMMSSQGLDCEDIGCGPPTEQIEAGVWRVMFAGGRFNGLYTYWIQGQIEPLLNYHNGVIRFQGHTVQIYQLIGNDKPIPIGQDLHFNY